MPGLRDANRLQTSSNRRLRRVQILVSPGIAHGSHLNGKTVLHSVLTKSIGGTEGDVGRSA